MFTPRGGFPSGMEGVVRKTRFPPAEIRVQVSPNAWVDTQLALKTRGPGAPPPPWCRHSGSQSSRTTSPCFICDVTPVSKVLSVQQEHGLPGGSADEESACDARDPSSIPGSGRSPREGKGYPLQYSGLENSMGCIVHGVTTSRTRLSLPKVGELNLELGCSLPGSHDPAGSPFMLHSPRSPQGQP